MWSRSYLPCFWGSDCWLGAVLGNLLPCKGLSSGWFDSQTLVRLSYITVVFGPRGLSLSPSMSLWNLLAGNVHVLVNEMRGRRTASLPELKDCLGKAFLRQDCSSWKCCVSSCCPVRLVLPCVPGMSQVCAQGWSQWIAEVASHDLCASQAGGSPWLKMIPLYLGFLHFTLMLPASPSLFAGCLCPSCCCPAGSAEHWGPLDQWLTPPVLPWSQELSAGISRQSLRYCTSGSSHVCVWWELS